MSAVALLAVGAAGAPPNLAASTATKLPKLPSALPDPTTMVPGESTVDVDDKKNPEKKIHTFPGVRPIVVTAETTLQQKPHGVSCTSIATTIGTKVRVFTAGHCFLLDKKVTPQSVIILNRPTVEPPALLIKVTPGAPGEPRLSPTLSSAYTAFAWKDAPLRENVERLMHSGAPETWPDDWAYFDVPATEWPSASEWSAEHVTVRPGATISPQDKILLIGAGCTSASGGQCKQTASAYVRNADTFTLAAVVTPNRRYSLVTASGAFVTLGDSGGPALTFSTSGPTLVGVISSNDSSHAPPWSVVQNLQGYQ